MSKLTASQLKEFAKLPRITPGWNRSLRQILDIQDAMYARSIDKSVPALHAASCARAFEQLQRLKDDKRQMNRIAANHKRKQTVQARKQTPIPLADDQPDHASPAIPPACEPDQQPQ